MNLRDIKKDIEYVIGAFVDDCALFLSVHPGKNADEVANLIDGAVDLFNELRDKLGKPEGNKKAWPTTTASARNSSRRPTPSTTSSARP